MEEIQKMKVWEKLEVFRGNEFSEEEADYLIRFVKNDLGLEY